MGVINLKVLCLLPILGIFFITMVPNNIEIIFLRRLEVTTLDNRFKIFNNLLSLEFKFFNFLNFARSPIVYLWLYNSVFKLVFKWWFFFEEKFYKSQLIYYDFLYYIFIESREVSFLAYYKHFKSLNFKKYLFYYFVNFILWGIHKFFFISYIHQRIALIFSLITFLYSLLFLVFFNIQVSSYQFTVEFANLCLLGVDGISIWFLILSTFLIFFCLFSNFAININKSSLNYSKLFLISFLSLDVFLILVFTALDFFYFYIFFELILIPMMFIIGLFGSRSRRIKAMFYFVMYTIVGSLCLLIGIFIYFSSLIDYLNLLFYDVQQGFLSVDKFFLIYNIYCVKPFLLFDQLEISKQFLIWLLFFIGFAIKVPMLPFHLWLPEAHVEAPTAGSMLLAGILLKLGGYGFIRFLLPLCVNILYTIIPIIYTLAAISIIYGSLTTLRQLDIKRIIAYSSIVHMNIGILGLFSNSFEGILGSILLMLAHGIVSPGLFYVVGILYDRFGSRLLEYYGGLVQLMPKLAFYFLLLILGNTSFPGTINFIGEIFNFIGLGFYSLGVLFWLLFFGIFFGTVYSFWLFNRIMFGELKLNYLLLKCNYLNNNMTATFDLTLLEVINLFILVSIMIIFGIAPNFISCYIAESVYFYLF